MPLGVIYVGRPSRFGNPWGNWCEVALSVALFEDTVNGIWNPELLRDYADFEVRHIYNERRDWLRQLGCGHPAEIVRADLAGKDLACWCRLDQICHADALLRVANGGAS
jgi:hypothetical protein